MTTIAATKRTGKKDFRFSTSTQLLQQEDERFGNESKDDESKLDRLLDRLTLCFPFFVVLAALVGFTAPQMLQWVNRGNLITVMLASVMMGTGMTLEKSDFTGILDTQATSVPTGVLCQYSIMPLAAWWVGRTFLLNSCELGSALFLGIVLVGCSPGGTASNLVSLIAKANVALSVLLTACSTILASLMTPLLVKLLVSQPGSGAINVSGVALCSATARVVLLPVVLGMAVKTKAPKLSNQLARFTPFGSVVLVSLICGGVVANNAATLLSSSLGSAGVLPRIILSVVLLHLIGFGVGYLVPRFGLGFSKKTARTISIETGMQNSALAVVLARSVGAHPLASLPGALSATAHSCLGSFLAAYWRVVDTKQLKEDTEE